MIDYKKTALVLIDLQKGILAMDTAPHDTTTVVRNAAKAVEMFRKNNGFVIFVRVKFQDGKDALSPKLATKPLPGKPEGDFSEFAEELNVSDQDYIVNKRGFSAFFGTDLDLQLRRRGIDTIVLGGISTHMGVDTTARDAYQYHYEQLFVTDMMSAPAEHLHDFSLNNAFPLMGKNVTTAELFNDENETK
ncbi:isochorismatase family protein [Macrococcoides canis]|uniref:isochorismatase family protein n=1 Tax=Macrococcoides canis TaxID=1855823 RepID=UPI0020B85AA1|nr:isochorismatase family protein [Macrococcus canis]UTH00206.1 isochorismatase family protein [Macrococcus canis]